jgi:heat-inducible transcriptional repressor
MVEEYVASAKPISSAAVLERSALNVSSATIRNELADLEELGLVVQLHTSGGRMPTSLGYRYYIERLLPAPDLSNDEQVTIRHQFYQARTEIDEWLRLAAAVIAHRVHNVAVITPPRAIEVRCKHVEFIAVQDHMALVIVVLTDGSVVQEFEPQEVITSQEDLSVAADLVNRAFYNLSASQAETAAQKLPPRLGSLAAAVVGLVRRASERRRQVYHEGLTEMLRQPEFMSARHSMVPASERLRRVIEFLQQGLAMEDLLTLLAMEQGVQVVIGGEQPLSTLHDYSMVVGRYGGDTEGSGVLGVLGPTRMEYGRAISLVRYMSDLMTDLLLGHG